MSNKDSHPIRNGAIASLIGGIALSFWTPFRDLLIKVFAWIWGLLISIWNWLSSLQEIYGWIVLALVLFAIPTLLEVFRLVFVKKEAGLEELYRSDNLFGALWKWQYSNGSIRNLWCLCPTCQSELVYSEFIPNSFDYTHDGLEPKTDFICERCKSSKCTLTGNKQHALGTVEREIRRKIRTDEWKGS